MRTRSSGSGAGPSPKRWSTSTASPRDDLPDATPAETDFRSPRWRGGLVVLVVPVLAAAIRCDIVGRVCSGTVVGRLAVWVMRDPRGEGRVGRTSAVGGLMAKHIRVGAHRCVGDPRWRFMMADLLGFATESSS